MTATFITVPHGERNEVTINVDEIAAYHGHVVTSYSYVDYTLVRLKSGDTYDCRIAKSDFEAKLRAALEAAS